MDEFHGVANIAIDLGSISLHCRHMLTDYFHDSKVEYSWRQTNRVAHAALFEVSSQTYDDVLPCIYDLVFNEMH